MLLHRGVLPIAATLGKMASENRNAHQCVTNCNHPIFSSGNLSLLPNCQILRVEPYRHRTGVADAHRMRAVEIQLDGTTGRNDPLALLLAEHVPELPGSQRRRTMHGSDKTWLPYPDNPHPQMLHTLPPLCGYRPMHGHGILVFTHHPLGCHRKIPPKNPTVNENSQKNLDLLLFLEYNGESA